MEGDPQEQAAYVAIGKQRAEGQARHWILLLTPLRSNREPADRGTYYHVQGGPTQNGSYKLTIDANKRVYSHGIERLEFLGMIHNSDVGKVKAAAQGVPPQQCQLWIVAVLEKLEKKHLLPLGTSAKLQAMVEPSTSATETSTTGSSSRASGSGAGASKSGASASKSGSSRKK